MSDSISEHIVLTVCATCTDTAASGEAGIGGGARLRELLQQQLDEHPQPQFLPRYTLLAVEAHEKELISEGELAGMLRIGRIETRELVESLNAFSESIEEAQHAQA